MQHTHISRESHTVQMYSQPFTAVPRGVSRAQQCCAHYTITDFLRGSAPGVTKS